MEDIDFIIQGAQVPPTSATVEGDAQETAVFLNQILTDEPKRVGDGEDAGLVKGA